MKNKGKPGSGRGSGTGDPNPSPADSGMSVFFHMVPDLLCVASVDGYFKKLNPAWESVLGFTIDELLSRPLIEFIHPDDVAGMIKEVEEHMEGKETKFFINRHPCKDNSYKWLEWQARPNPDRTELYAIARDVTERKKAEQALRESEEKYSTAFTTSPDSITINKLDGTYVDVNKGFTELSGYTKEQVVGTGSLDLGIWALPADRETVIELLQKTGSVKNLESVFRCQDGSLKTVLISASMIQINHEPHILSVTRDISQRKMTEKALRESEEKYRLLAVNSSDVIWTMNLEGQYLYVSPSVLQLRGYTVEETMLHGIEGTLTPDSAAIARKAFAELLPMLQSAEGLPTQTFVLEQTCKNGSAVWTEMTVNPFINDNHQLIGFIGITRNITERRKAEEKLMQAMAAIETASDAIGISDDQNHIILMNKAMVGLFEFETSEELEAAGGWQVCIKDPVVGKEIYGNIVEGNSWAGEVEMVTKSGRRFPGLVRANAIKDTHGNIIGLLGIITDFTMRAQSEEKLKQSEEIFRLLADYSPNMIFIFMKNKIYYANQLCMNKLGYTKEELYAPDFDFVKLAAPEHQKALVENFLLYESGKPLEPYELLMKSKDGKSLYTMVNTKLIQIGRENAILGVIMDISEQRWAEEILKRKANQFEHFNQLMVDRELKMVELKKEVNQLLERLGENAKYEVFSNPSPEK